MPDRDVDACISSPSIVTNLLPDVTVHRRTISCSSPLHAWPG